MPNLVGLMVRILSDARGRRWSCSYSEASRSLIQMFVWLWRFESIPLRRSTLGGAIYDKSSKRNIGAPADFYVERRLGR